MNIIRRGVLCLALCSLMAMPVFAAEDPSQALKSKMMQVMSQHPEALIELMSNPNHLLGMAYGDGMFGFATAMKKAATKGDEIAPDFARTAVKEMKRDLDQMEKYHGEALKTMSQENKALLQDLPALMQTHLAEVHKRMDHLSDQVEKEPVRSKDVMDDLDYLLQHCRMRKQGMHGGGEGMSGGGDMTSAHRMMSQKMQENAELEGLVDKMNKAPANEKMGLMEEIINRLVEDRGMGSASGMGGPMLPENHPMIMQQPMGMPSYEGEGQEMDMEDQESE